MAQGLPEGRRSFHNMAADIDGEVTPQPVEGAADEVGDITADPTAELTVETPEAPTIEPTEEPTQESTEETTAEATQEPVVPPDEPVIEEAAASASFSWSLLIDDITGDEIEQAIQLQGRLEDAGLTSDIRSTGKERYTMQVAGEDGTAEIREALYEYLDGKIDFIGGAAEVSVEMPVTGQEPFSISLESNLSTGYRWEVVEAESGGAGIRSSQTFSYRGGTGTPEKQTITFSPTRDGKASIRLVYRRPFEAGDPIHRHLAVQFGTVQDVIDLSDPTPRVISARESKSSTADSQPIDEIPLRVELPLAWDWRDEEVVPAVRDQGYCGSCWAFGTVGVMESAVAIDEGSPPDLSEQFLVSCNRDGWDCDGGLTAHKYHYDSLGVNQSEIGAVLEADKPYTATNGSCTVAYNHPYQLTGWEFVTGSEWTVPSVAAIKNAIYTFGPVTAGICAGSAFDYYDGGVFSTNESCGGYTNHQIVLVGWDDADEVWILRNSWGANWGEGGYMRIKYGTSRVGEGTSWVTMLDPAPGQIVLESPANKALTNDSTTDFNWQSQVYSDTYHLQIALDSKFANIVEEQENISGTSTSSGGLSDGRYYWRVRGKNAYGLYGDWNPGWYFTLDTVAPEKPLLSKPVDGSSIVGTPTFSWRKGKGTVVYQFEYNDSDDPDNFIHRSPEIAKTPKYSPPAMETMTTYYWYARAGDAAGNWSEWSDPFTIMVVPPLPGSPTLVSPANKSATNDTTPTFDWLDVNYDEGGYELMVDDDKRFGSPEIDGFTLEGVTEFTPTTVTLADGKYYWKVRAQNENVDGWGNWSKTVMFTVDTVPPAAPVQRDPADEVEVVGTPAFQWNKVKDAVTYRFEYNNSDDPDGWIHRSDALPRSTKYTPPVMEANTTFYWYVQAQDAAGNWSEWSEPFRVTVLPPLPVAPALISPESDYRTTDTSIVFTWGEVDYGYKYQLQVDDASTFSNPYYEIDTGEGETGYTVDSMSGGKWYWRVRAQNSQGTGPWSGTGVFIIYSAFDTQFNSDDDKENWVGHPGASWYVESGSLYNMGLDYSRTSSASYEDLNYWDFTYEARIRMEAPEPGSSNEYGLVFRGNPVFDSFNDWKHGYYYSVWQDNTSPSSPYSCINVARIVNGKWSYLDRYWSCYDQNVFNFGGFNTLKVVANGSSLNFFTNDYLLMSVNDSGLITGRLGVYSYGDNLYAYKTEVDWATAGPPELVTAMQMSKQAEAVGYLMADEGADFHHLHETQPVFVPVE